MENGLTLGRLLVVDDSVVNRMLLSSILTEAGYDVGTATCGAEALEAIASSIPELILLDIQMPDMTGYDVCRQLKANARFNTIPVVFISALDAVFDKIAAFEAGGVDYVTKPFEPQEVLARVGTQIRLYRLQRELRQRNYELQRRNEQLLLANQRTERIFVALSEALPGTVLDDTYRLETKIGEGGFGAVFRGMHLTLERPVAIKVLRPSNGQDASADLARFRREGVAACRISHPNAVEVLDFAVSSTGIAYLVMELLEGSTLGSLLRQQPILTVRRAAEIGAPVCDALAAAHAAGIVHRDIKPDNVFLHQATSGEVVKVVDFGIAKLLDDEGESQVTMKGSMIGTPEFMAPERLLGAGYDERSDVYSIGVMLYLMLSGQTPFPEHTRSDLANMIRFHLSSDVKPLHEANRSVPLSVSEVVMNALDRTPEKRPRPADLAAQLRAAAL